MSSIGFLGMGKIGRAVLAEARRLGCEVAYVLDPFLKDAGDLPVVAAPAAADLVVESATADALKGCFDEIIKQSDVLVFSLTAFSDAAFYDHVQEMTRLYGHKVYIPHGAILGLDGIRDGREIITSVSIETIKSPASLGLTLEERTVVFEGSTREACGKFPRNVNVHAAVALAGIGFDKTVSRIIADPAVKTNTHHIHVEGEGISFGLDISSFTTGGVTGVYTPASACGSLRRILAGGEAFAFV